MNPNMIRDLFEPKARFSLMEDASGEVDGVNILAKVRGEFFFPDGMSRNRRFYPKKAWDNVLNDGSTQDRLEKRLMFGTVGHDQELNDKAVREGKVSHFMTKLWMEGDKGMGEAYILNTPVGQVLNTMLRAGSQLAVSSRADGRFKGQQQGVPAIDPDNFSVIGWDFVTDPGFLKANPEIAEAFSKTIGEPKTGGEYVEKDAMQKLVEHITNENHDLKSKNGELTTEATSLRESNQVLAEENKHLKEQLEASKAPTKVLEAYQAIGTPEDISKVMEVAEKASTVLESYKVLGTPAQIKEAFEKTAKYVKHLRENFGSTREIAAVFRAAGKLNERLLKVGTIGEIEKMTESFGKMITEAEEMQAETEKQAQMKEAEDIAKEVGAPVEDVAELLKTKSGPEVKAMYAKVEENLKKKLGITEAAQPASPYRKKNTEPVVESRSALSKEELSESSILSRRYANEESAVLGKDRIERMNEAFAK